MQHIDGSLVSLLQGVSQQAARDRKPGQHTLQENMSADVVRGLIRRAPAELSARLIPANDPDPTGWNVIHTFISDILYIIFYKAGKIRVFNTTGVEQTVTIGAGAAAYLTTDQLQFITVDNKTYIANTSKVAAMSTELPTTVRGNGLVYVMGGAYGRTYTVTIKAGFDSTGLNPTINQTVSHLTPDGSTSAQGAQIATTYIATKLYDLLVANSVLNAAFTITRASDVILLVPKSGQPTDMEITVDDGVGTNLYGISSFIGDAAKLPRYAAPNQLVIIKGIEGSADDWYVRFDQEKPGFGNDGIWRECQRWDEPYKFDLSTMPHVLTRDTTTGAFTFAQGAWKERRVGDNNTVPAPSCVGTTINDLAVFQGRLVMACGAAVLMSRTNRYEDLWPKSATTVLDSDPIDVESSVTNGAEMQQLIPHNYDLVVFAKRQQFVVFGRNALTPKNTSLVLTTSYEADLNASPVSGGRNVFFCMRYGKYTGVREFYTESNIDANNSDTVTGHVTQYIVGQPVQLSASSNFDTMLVRTATDYKVVYCYQYVWNGQERAQAAWSKLLFAQPVLYTFFSENILYFVQQCTDGVYLSIMNMDRLSEDGLSFQVHLDAKVVDTNVHTTLQKPTWADPAQLVYIQGAGCPNPGLRLKVESIGDTAVVFTKDMQGGSVISGLPYTSKFSPTRPFMRDKNGEPVMNGTMHITKYRVAYSDSGPFTVSIDSPFRDTIDVENTGRAIGSIQGVIGKAPVSAGTLVIPTRADPEYGGLMFTCDSYMPMALSGIEWEGQYTKRGTRV